MDGAVLSVYEQIMWFLGGEDLKSILSMDLSSFMHDAYKLVIDAQNTVVGPIALSLLSVFILLEFQKISMKVEGAGGAPMLGFEMIIKALIKFVLCYIVVIKIQYILDGIIAITTSLTRRLLDGPGAEVAKGLYGRVEGALKSMQWWEKLIVLLVFAILFLAAAVVRTLIMVTVYVRFLELYIFSAMAPIPMGALPNQEFSSMSKGFFKNFAALGLQSCFIGLILVIFPMIFLKVMEQFGNGIWGVILGLTIYMIALLLSINKTKGWAKTLLSAS